MLEEFKEKLLPYKNTLVIDTFDKVVRLVDVVYDDSDSLADYYWVYEKNNQIYYSSCVGGWIPLKGFLRDEDYNKMVRLWNLNNIEHAD